MTTSVTDPSPSPPIDENFSTNPATTTNEDLQQMVAKLQSDLEDTKQIVSQLSEEFAALKIYIYNIGLKETPLSLS